jgi:predicted metal-dependent enzyme (double-stranded beta helix superfamily)
LLDDVMFDLDKFIDDCRAAVAVDQPTAHAVVAEALADPERFDAAMRTRAQPWFFAADDTMTLFCTDGRVGSASAPHNHGTWSVLGCFLGAEESWWHRDNPGSGLVTVGSGILRAGDVHSLPPDAIHAVMNRWNVPNGIVHLYAGNFLMMERHIWDPVTLERHVAGLAEPHAPLLSRA